jgi:hypothetical protein
MPYKDPEIRRAKAREYQATHRSKAKQFNFAPLLEARFCQLCGTDITAKRKNALFCSREHKRKALDARRNYAVEYQKNIVVRRSQALRYYYNNHTQAKEKQLAKQKAHPAKYAATAAKHRAAKMQRTPAWLTEDDYWLIKQAYELAAIRTKLFGFTWHVDHVIPLQGNAVSGLHVPQNLQVIPGAQNIAKNNKFEVTA